MKRVQGSRWVALLPDSTLAVASLTARATFLEDPAQGVSWAHAPMVSEAQKADYVRRATDLIQNNRTAGLELPL